MSLEGSTSSFTLDSATTASSAAEAKVITSVVPAAVDGWMFDRLTHSVPHEETIKRGTKVLRGSIGDE